jgi:hypothetical protein
MLGKVPSSCGKAHYFEIASRKRINGIDKNVPIKKECRL